MIATIRGVITQKEGNTLVVMVGGVGVEVFATRVAAEKAEEGKTVDLITRLIVREDSLTLYGFAAVTERDMFDLLIKISGVGPKLALVILSTLSIDNLRSAVLSERAELLTRVPGIGKKTAEKILLELRNKLPVGLDAAPVADFSDTNSDVMDALIGLGFSVVEAQTAVQALPANAADNVEERVRLSLQFLSS